MRKKISVLVVMLLICLSSFLIISTELKVEASGEGGGDSGGIGLDKGFVWMITENLSHVVYDAYDPGDIRKGRAWATKGEDYTIEHILFKYMNGTAEDDWCNLSNVTKLPIGYLSDHPKRNYSSKVVTHDFQLIVNNASDKPYPYPQYVPKNESFPIPTGWKDWNTREMDVNYSLNNVTIELKNMTDLWPFAASYNNYYLNVSCGIANDYNTVIGNVSYLSVTDTVPEEKEGQVFIIEDKQGCQEKLDSMISASGCILMCDSDTGIQNADTANCNFAALNVSSDDGNLSDIISMLENGTRILVDNVYDSECLTFTYNLTEQTCLPSEDYVCMDRIPTPYELYNTSARVPFHPFKEHLVITDYMGLVHSKASWLYHLNLVSGLPKCYGFILYDSYDTHLMYAAIRDWHHVYLFNFPALPIFSINISVGDWLNKNRTGTTISGYLNQTFEEQTPSSNGVTSHNVVGYRNTTHSPDDSIVIISNRMDGWWGQTPGDSGVGGAITLGIAKYFNDHNITPKYNLTFLMTTGEEYGLRGAFHYSDSHDDDNVIAFIGLDQLAFNQSDTNLSISYGNKSYHWSKSKFKEIVMAIADKTSYDSRTNYSLEHEELGGESGGEDNV